MEDAAISGEYEHFGSAAHEELFALACQPDPPGYDGSPDDTPSCRAIGALRLRGTDDVYRMAVSYTRSPLGVQRARALDVLAQWGCSAPAGQMRFLDERVDIAIASLSDPDPEVIRSAAWALSHLESERGRSILLACRTSPDPEVRWAVAFGLLYHHGDECVTALLELMVDPDDRVRDWATFSLAQATDSSSEDVHPLDSPRIRAALTRQLSDPYLDARDEALWGLAARKDPTALRTLLGRLESNSYVAGDEMAARDVLGALGTCHVDTLCQGLRGLLSG